MICCEAGEIRVLLATTLFIAWVAVFFCIHKCIKSSGKVNENAQSNKIHFRFTSRLSSIISFFVYFLSVASICLVLCMEFSST